jgi:hypothetical protein
MRLLKVLSITSISVSLAGLAPSSAMAQDSTVRLKDISSATLVSLTELSQSRLPVHKNISCSQIYQHGQHVFTDCQDSDGYIIYSNTSDDGWQQNQPACAISIEEPVVRIENNPGILQTLFGSFLESNIKVNAGEFLELDGGYTSQGKDAIELEAKSPDGNKVHIKCFNLEATTADLESDLAGIIEVREIRRVRSDQVSGTPIDISVEAADDDSSESSSDAASSKAQSEDLPSGSDSHPADGKVSQPVVDPADVQSLERNI